MSSDRPSFDLLSFFTVPKQTIENEVFQTKL